MRCCIKLQENLQVVSEQGRIFHMLYVYSNLVLEYHVHYLRLMVLLPYQIHYRSIWQKKKNSFLNLDLLNSNVSGESERRWWKKHSSTITTSTISGLFETPDFSSSSINVLLVVLSILPSIWHRLRSSSIFFFLVLGIIYFQTTNLTFATPRNLFYTFISKCADLLFA